MRENPREHFQLEQNPRTRVYLAGGIFGLPDSECRDWREKAKELLNGFDFADPMDRDYRGREDECYEEIVSSDLDDIASCDIVLVNISQKGWGTPMEMFYARNSLGMTVIAFGGGEKVSPWVRYTCEYITDTLEDACAIIKRLEVLG